MAIQYPNFLNAPIVPRDYSAMGNIVSNFYKGQSFPRQALIEKVKAQFAQPNAQAELNNAQLKNDYQSIMNQFAPEKAEADIEKVRLDNIYQQIANQFAPQKIQAEIEARKRFGMGGARTAADIQRQIALQQQLKHDNPGFTDDQAYEAAGNLLDGMQTLNDGMPFNVGGLAKNTAGGALLKGTTAALATQGVRAAQAEAEIPIVDKYISEGVQPYAKTVMGYSPQQAADMASPDNKEAQTRLGKLAAANLLQLEKAALGLKMAGIESGVTIMQEAMSKANQSIKEVDWIKTPLARQVAQDTYREALNKMLAARQEKTVLNSGLNGKLKSKAGENKNSGAIKYKIVNGKLIKD